MRSVSRFKQAAQTPWSSSRGFSEPSWFIPLGKLPGCGVHPELVTECFGFSVWSAKYGGKQPQVRKGSRVWVRMGAPTARLELEWLRAWIPTWWSCTVDLEAPWHLTAKIQMGKAPQYCPAGSSMAWEHGAVPCPLGLLWRGECGNAPRNAAGVSRTWNSVLPQGYWGRVM